MSRYRLPKDSPFVPATNQLTAPDLYGLYTTSLGPLGPVSSHPVFPLLILDEMHSSFPAHAKASTINNKITQQQLSNKISELTSMLISRALRPAPRGGPRLQASL
ncbi:unnamed protein product [Lota lota]